MSDTILKLIEGDAEPKHEPTSAKSLTMKYLLKALLKHGASDLHLKVGRPPLFRINGKLIPSKMPSLDLATVKSLIYGVLKPRIIASFEERLQVDASFSIESVGRFRINIYNQRNTMAAVIRMIPHQVSDLETLGLPLVLKEIVAKRRGLLLITGPTGSGKSTTLASLVNYINQSKYQHIITIEDPIEYIHKDAKSSISQREIGQDVVNMEEGLLGALRQDPDIIILGELRSQETIQTALTAAETGHLVISTLHTYDARSTIDRIIDVFPANSKNQVRIQLSASLLAVVSQKLVMRADKTSRVPACEILIKSPTIESLIIKNELDKIDEVITQSNAYYKMQSFNQALESMVMRGIITNEEAIFSSNSPEDLKMRLSGFKKEEGY